MTGVRVACIQTNSGPDPDRNSVEVGEMIRQAAADGAELVTTPEIVGMFEPDRTRALAAARPEESHQVLARFREIAAEEGIWLLIGSLSISIGDDMLSNRSFLVAPDGHIVARYSKIHMFDVQVGDGATYRESRTYRPGEKAVLAATPWGMVGMTICYDVRFPALYRGLAQAGAGMIFVPAAFTRVTGEAHWHVLQRARAIENGCFIIAPAQTGTHAGNRRTYGHSLIVAPWGEILADGGTETGITMADCDLDAVDTARARVPSLTHDRPYSAPVPGDHALRLAGE